MESRKLLNPETRDEHVARYIAQSPNSPSLRSGMSSLKEGEELELGFAPKKYALACIFHAWKRVVQCSVRAAEDSECLQAAFITSRDTVTYGGTAARVASTKDREGGARHTCLAAERAA
jgi:hypothetical protein